MLPVQITSPLTRFLDEEDGAREALAQACDAVRTTPVDMAVLLDWLQRYDGPRDRKQRAQIALRAALGLPLIPGPPCRAN